MVTDEEEAAAASPRSETEGEEATAPAEREADIGTSSFEKYLPTPRVAGAGRSRGFWLEPELKFSPGSGSYSYSTVLKIFCFYGT